MLEEASSQDAPEADGSPAVEAEVSEPRYVDPDSTKAEPAEVEADSDDEESEDGLEQYLDDDEEGESGDDDPEAEFVEVEYEGEKFKLPPKLKDALMRESDYTKKTTEVAEQRKAIEAQQEQFQRNVQMQQQFFDQAADVRAIEQQLQNIDQNTDWDSLSYDDPVEFQRKQWQRSQLIEQRNNTVHNMTQAQQQAIAEQQQHAAKLREQGTQQLAKEIPGWSRDTARAIASYGTTQGYSQEEVSSILDPRHVKILDKARRYDEIVAKSKKPKAKQPEAQPVQEVKGRKSSGKSNRPSDGDDIKTWMEKREKQLRAKGKR